VSADYLREFSYFLMGPYGNGTLRYPTTNRAETKKYRYSELGPTFRAMSNRLSHASREIESRLVSEKYEERKNSYVELKKFFTEFDKQLKECSQQWKTTVYSVRSDGGVEKTEISSKKKFTDNTRFVKFKRRTFNDSNKD
jgi:hypothetical protein